MGTEYQKRDNRIRYLVQWLDYPDWEDWIEELLDDMTTDVSMLRDFQKSNPDVPRNPRPSN
jgi:hypothetical protein